MAVVAPAVLADTHLAKVSVGSAGMQSGPDYASRMIRTQFKAGINIELITTSEIRIACLIEESQAPWRPPLLTNGRPNV